MGHLHLKKLGSNSDATVGVCGATGKSWAQSEWWRRIGAASKGEGQGGQRVIRDAGEEVPLLIGNPGDECLRVSQDKYQWTSDKMYSHFLHIYEAT